MTLAIQEKTGRARGRKGIDPPARRLGRRLVGNGSMPTRTTLQLSKGDRGHDEFRVVESTLVRRFPVYREGDTNAKPTGGTRQIQYKLAAGEAGWVLRADKVVEY